MYYLYLVLAHFKNIYLNGLSVPLLYVLYSQRSSRRIHLHPVRRQRLLLRIDGSDMALSERYIRK